MGINNIVAASQTQHKVVLELLSTALEAQKNAATNLLKTFSKIATTTYQEMGLGSMIDFDV